MFVELKEAKRRKKRMAEQLKHEEALAAALKVWNTEILKDWETMYVIFIASLECIYTERKGMQKNEKKTTFTATQ